MRTAILCLGSQGDVRPFIALGSALKREGHDVFIASNPPNEEFCTQNGFRFVPLDGDFAACVSASNAEAGLGKIQIVKELFKIVKESLRQQFETLSTELRNIDAVIYHPVVFTAGHVLEALKIPSICVHFQPNIRSRHYACCMFPPRLPLRKWSNPASHFIAAQIFWIPFRKTFNEWRAKLGLKKLGFLAPDSHPPFQDTPKLIAVSQALIPPTPDWPKNVHVTGHLQLPQADTWTPPQSLQQFLTEGPPPLYIGFGSLTEMCNQKMSASILATLQHLSTRTILCGPFHSIKQEELPPHVLKIDTAPHDWLFPKVAAIVHHGGSGTTHASLLAGKPTLIVPFALDQFHWGDIVYRRGAGPQSLPAKKFTQDAFLASIQQLLNTPSYQTQALTLSQEMQRENGIQRVLEVFYQRCANWSQEA